MLAACAVLAGAVCLAQEDTAAAGTAHAGEYALAPQRSSVTFDVDAFSHSRISMRFHRMHAQLAGTEGGLEGGRVTVTIDAASLEARPRFLSPIIRGDGLLDVGRYPEISFVSTRFVRTGEGNGLLSGRLTIRGITRDVTLRVTPAGTGEPPREGAGLAFAAAGSISRRDFGLSAWSPLVGDDVRMRIEVDFEQER